MSAIQKLNVNETLLDAVVEGTLSGLEMTGIKPNPVGATRFFSATCPYSIIVGFSGESSGTMTINMGEKALLLLSGRLLDMEFTECTEEALDAVMELGNMTGGCIKDRLRDSEFSLDYLSLPSLVLGASHNLYYSRGINSITVTFELTEIPMMFLEDRVFSVTVSLLRSIAQ